MLHLIKKRSQNMCVRIDENRYLVESKLHSLNHCSIQVVHNTFSKMMTEAKKSI